jgi:hypothetical protein
VPILYGSVRLRAGHDALKKINISCSCRESNHNSWAVQPERSHYTDYSINKEGPKVRKNETGKYFHFNTKKTLTHFQVTQGKSKHGMQSSPVSRQDNFVVKQLRRTKLFSLMRTRIAIFTKRTLTLQFGHIYDTPLSPQ